VAKVTMQDVARRAGVSAMTVSNVINDQPYVRAETRRKVRAAIAEAGYELNVTARNLRRGRTGVIGLAVPEVDRPYFGLLADEVIRAAEPYGYGVVVEQTGALRELELQTVARTRLLSYDGLVLSAVGLAGEDASLLRGDLPIVLLGERSYSQPVDHVVMPNVEGGRLATDHLMDRGCAAVAMIGGRIGGPADIDVVTLRAQGYVAAHTAHRRAVDPRLVRGCALTLRGGYETAAELLHEDLPFDGLFCSNDLVAIGAIRALVDAGRRVPQDVKVVGFDDVPLVSYLTPSLTTVSPAHRDMAETAVRLLVGRIFGERDPADHQEIVARCHLEVRESTATASPQLAGIRRSK
jgi:DNA-binding LacI/PurR family transcriptional regulator